MRIRVQSTLIHQPTEGEGVRGFLVSSRAGMLKQAAVHHGRSELNVATLDVQTGETLDFVADIGKTLSYNQFLWQATIAADDESGVVFDSKSDFENQGQTRLTPWEQLAQVLLSANEFVFID
jgi:hypothetical protein